MSINLVSVTVCTPTWAYSMITVILALGLTTTTTTKTQCIHSIHLNKETLFNFVQLLPVVVQCYCSTTRFMCRAACVLSLCFLYNWDSVNNKQN